MVRGFRILPRDEEQEAEWQQFVIQSENKSHLASIVQSAKYSFVSGAIYGLCSRFLSSLSYHSPFKLFFNRETPLYSIITSIDLASLPVVNRISFYFFRPNLNNVYQYSIFLAANSISAAALSNLIFSRKFSMAGYFKNTIDQSLSNFGFTLGDNLAQHYLPPQKELGGKLARDSLLLASGMTGSFIARIPFYRAFYDLGLLSQIRYFTGSLTTVIPTVVEYHCLSRVIKKIPFLQG